MDLKITLHRRAQQDLQEIQTYLFQVSGAQAAERVRTHLRRKIRRLTNSPRMGKPTTNSDIRILPPTRYPYRIYYTIQGDNIVILHIRHTSRQVPDDLEP